MLRSIKVDQRPTEVLGRGGESWLENKEKEEATLDWASRNREKGRKLRNRRSYSGDGCARGIIMESKWCG